MGDAAVIVTGLAKRYRIGARDEMPDTFIGSALDTIRRPWKNLRRLRRLAHFDDDDGDVIWALRDVSFEIERGEVVGIIGRNGAGKSTLLKILSRITYPTAGRVELHGRVASLLEVGTGFHPELTGRDNIYLNGTILGMSKREIDAKFDQIVAFSGVEKFLDTPVKRYSSGMGVRLAFSVAAHLDPEILLVDEVLAVGDAAFQQKCLGKMGEVARAGRTVLLVSHNMSSILRFCPRTLWLEDGLLAGAGESSEITKAYLRRTLHVEREEPHVRQIDLRNEGVVIEKIWITGKDGDAAVFPMGEPLAIHMRIRGVTEPARLRIGLMIEDTVTGTRVLTLSTDTQAPSPLGNLDCGAAVLACELPEPPFIQGSYSISVALSYASKTEYVENALIFTVVPADVFGTGVIPGRNRGLVYTPSCWHGASAVVTEP